MAQPGTPQPVGGTKLVIAALVLALVAVVLVNVYISRVRAQVEQSSFTIYRFARPMREGEKVEKKDVEAVLVPDSFRASFEKMGALTETELNNRDRDPLKQSARQGAIVTLDLFVEPEERDLQYEVAKGMRLVSMPVNSKTVPGNIRPGSYVDIEAAFNTGGAVPTILPVMERVRVVAVGSRSITDPTTPGRTPTYRDFKAITIEVTPQDATALSMVEKLIVGEFELYLRNPGDNDRVKIQEPGVNPVVKDLVDKLARRPAPVEERK